MVGGNETKTHEFPWVAGLSHGGEYHCGAALISKRHLITAAHCVSGYIPPFFLLPLFATFSTTGLTNVTLP